MTEQAGFTEQSLLGFLVRLYGSASDLTPVSPSGLRIPGVLGSSLFQAVRSCYKELRTINVQAELLDE